MQFQISSRRENGKEIIKLPKLEFLQKYLANSFALSDAEENNSEPLNRGGINNLAKVSTVKFLGSNGLLFYWHMQV